MPLLVCSDIACWRLELGGSCSRYLALADQPVIICLQLYAWGWGRYGNLGDGEKADR